MRRGWAIASFFTFLLLFPACREVAAFLEPDPPAFTFDTLVVRRLVQEQLEKGPVRMYADCYMREQAWQDSSFLWVSPNGVSPQADALLEHLGRAGDLGVDTALFHTALLKRDVADLRSRITEGVTRDSVDTLMARLEFSLTQALLRYACGQRYGFVKPRLLMNRQLQEKNATGQTYYRRTYDIPCEMPTDSFARAVLSSVREERVGQLLAEVQPTDSLYHRLQRDYLQALDEGNGSRARLARINMERARWRYPRPQGGKYIWVNLAGFMLTAVDTEQNHTLSMKVCGGDSRHKTPLLISSIRYVEFNPYWVIPQSIVRKEIVVRHLGDSAYFARNRIHAIEKSTQEEVDPTLLTEAELRSARYTLRQERGEGNSLGRMVFRFPNNFAVYLHDTNNRAAFLRKNRAVSHGCVRLEKPLELALFLLGEADELTIDRIRMTIDLPPLSPRGQSYLKRNPEGKPLSGQRFPHAVPLWLDYYTLYPDSEGHLQEHPDSYGYDTALEKALNGL